MRAAWPRPTMGQRPHSGRFSEAAIRQNRKERSWEQARNKRSFGAPERVTGPTTTSRRARPSTRQSWTRPGWARGPGCSMSAAAADSRCCWRPARAPRCQGIDATPALVEIARERVPGAPLAVGDLEDPLPYGAGAFDVVTAFNSVQFAGDPVAVVKNMSQVVRPGGLISLVVWGPPEQCESGVLFAELGPLLPPSPPWAPGPIAWSEEGQLEHLAGLRRPHPGHRPGRAQSTDLPRPRDGGAHSAQLRARPGGDPALRPACRPGRADPRVRRQPQTRRHLPAGERVPLPHREDLTADTETPAPRRAAWRQPVPAVSPGGFAEGNRWRLARQPRCGVGGPRFARSRASSQGCVRRGYSSPFCPNGPWRLPSPHHIIRLPPAHLSSLLTTRAYHRFTAAPQVAGMWPFDPESELAQDDTEALSKGFLVSACVDEMAGPQPEHRTVGEQLVKPREPGASYVVSSLQDPPGGPAGDDGQPVGGQPVGEDR